MNNPATTFFGWFTLSNVVDTNTLLTIGGTYNQFRVHYDPTNEPPFTTWEVRGSDMGIKGCEVFETLGEGVPFMVAAYYDGKKIGLSVNGSEWVENDAPNGLHEEVGMLFQSAWNGGNAGPVSCSKFRIYPRVLTNAEIASLYQEGA